MKLYVCVLQAKDMPGIVKEAYVKLQVGKHKSKTKTSKTSTGAVWNEEFVFRVRRNRQERLVVSVFSHDPDGLGLFNGSGDLVGRVRIPVWEEAAAEVNQSSSPTWYRLETPNTGKFIDIDCGKVLLILSLHRTSNDQSPKSWQIAAPDLNKGDFEDSNRLGVSSNRMYSSKPQPLKVSKGKKLANNIVSCLEKVFHKNEESSKSDHSTELSSASSDYEDSEHPGINVSFEEAIEIMRTRNNEQEMPEELQGGILVDQIYVVSPSDLSSFLFAPGSQFRKDLAELQGTTDWEEGPWTWKSADMSCLTRSVSYTKAATKLVKAVKATEEQILFMAEGEKFAVLATVSTPDVPYGNTFTIELLYTIAPGPQPSPDEESSHLVISWAINFHQSTMMKGMIEEGARKGLKDSFDQFANLLAKSFKMLADADTPEKDHILATLEAEHQSYMELAYHYFWNFTVVSTMFMVLYVVVHILLCEPNIVQGLEFNGLDLPDSFGQLIFSAILVIQLERVYNMVSHFVQARFLRVSDHGIRAQRDGWVLTVALIEGSNLSSVDSSGLSDPYVVLTCNGKTKTSSVQLQTSNPQWNDILEFDAMEEPPSVLYAEVFDFDGPFDRAASLGYAEVNFLKHTSTELSDMWVPLEGKLAQSTQSKLHLRIFVDNNKGVETIQEYLTKMEKEVGKKLNIRSPHRNLVFQKLFGLPPEEFLIKDYTCHLRRKIPLQGKVFLSARIFGFYANLFGHKTKFFFLWEDIEDIQVLPPSLSSVGSPSLVIILRKGRGLEARDWAKSQDEEGRLRFYFQSFASFNAASRTIMAFWRTKTPTPEPKPQITEEQQRDHDKRLIILEESGHILEVEDSEMSKIYSAELPICMQSLMELFDGGDMELKVMERSGFLDYAATPWVPVKPSVYERHLAYRFTRHVSIFGGEVTSTQQKSPLENDAGWIVNQVMVLHDVPLDDHFNVNIKYLIQKSSLAQSACKCDVYVGITWLKTTKFQRRITRNIIGKFTHIVKDMFELVERGFFSPPNHTVEDKAELHLP